LDGFQDQQTNLQKVGLYQHDFTTTTAMATTPIATTTAAGSAEAAVLLF